jgi:hypothetical protein
VLLRFPRVPAVSDLPTSRRHPPTIRSRSSRSVPCGQLEVEVSPVFVLLMVILVVTLLGLGLLALMIRLDKPVWGLLGLVLLIIDGALGAVYEVLASI